MHSYPALERRFARLSRLDGALGILGWDKDTLMPLGAASERGEQIATLSVIRHELLTAAETGDLLDGAEQDEAGTLGPWQSANLREMRRAYRHATAVPADLVEAASRAATACEVTWRRARADSDFAALLPSLSEVLVTQRAIGTAKGEAFGLSAYDALLDQFDPGMRAATIDPIFATLRQDLPELLADAMAAQARQAAPPPATGPFPVEAQRVLGERLMRIIGFDFDRGRLDVSVHPFCGGATDDVRITTRYDEADFSSALMGVLHETGHALYEQGLPTAWRGQPVGQARGMTLHESQSLLIEMQACHGDAFLGFLAGLLQESFGPDPAFSARTLLARYRKVAPSLIRVDADEVTYPAHVLVRYGIERDLIGGELSLRDLPAAFNDGIHGLLGIAVPDDRRGCLQDVHWPCGLWGYFPTYTLGAITAAQLFDAAMTALPGLDDQLGKGEFGSLRAWLGQQIHARASLEDTQSIIRSTTGRTLDVDTYRRHLRRRYVTA